MRTWLFQAMLIVVAATVFLVAVAFSLLSGLTRRLFGIELWQADKATDRKA